MHRRPAAQAQAALVRIPYQPVVWQEIVGRYPDAEVFHTPAWLEFLKQSQGVEPVVATVRDGDRPVGHFVGAIVRRFGMRILGSPLPGWGTMHMGFLLQNESDRLAATKALVPWAFRELGCLHVELSDQRLSVAQLASLPHVVEQGRTFVVDLTGSDEQLLARMRATTRNYIRRGERDGLRVDHTREISFADEYYDLLQRAFARQGLAPTYGVERVRQLIRALEPSGDLLLQRTTRPDGSLLATAITVGHGRAAVLWGAAFDREIAIAHPNELLHWDAMRYWRDQGAQTYDLGGGGAYKAKYGGIETPIRRLIATRYPGLLVGRAAMRRLARWRQVLAARSLVR